MVITSIIVIITIIIMIVPLNKMFQKKRIYISTLIEDPPAIFGYR